MIIGYLDDFGPVYKTYGVATVDETVPLNEKTLFGSGRFETIHRNALGNRK